MTLLKSNAGLGRAVLSLRIGIVDLWVSNDGTKAMVISPWYADEKDKRPAFERVKEMGFTDVVEGGHMPGYAIPGVDTRDFDYIEFCVARVPSIEADCG